MNVAVIGTSSITEHHINSLKKYGVNISCISSTRKNSKILPYLVKKYKFNNYFTNWKKAMTYVEYNIDNIDFFLISGRFIDNNKIISQCLKFNKKILIEKPVFVNSKKFNFLQKYKKNIFVGYNRTKFNNIIYLKNLLLKKKNLICIVKIPEINKKLFFLNSCHILSILKFLFGRIKIYNRSTNKNHITLGNSKVKIDMFINFSNSDNFSIEIFSNQNRYLVCPMETLNIFEKLKKKRIGINNIYFPLKKKLISEKLNNSFKPGFNKQSKDFIKFLENGKIPYENSLNFAREIIKLSEDIFA
jgi:predicted dehydrogenase